MNEFDLIEYLKRKVPKSDRVPLGIGDDAAVVIPGPGKQLVVSTDAIVEDVDFILKELSPEKIGRKALAINLSDLAAIGAKPLAFVIMIGKPKTLSTDWLKRFYDGLLKLAEEYEVPCVGGDFSRAKEFFANVTIFGTCPPRRAVKRSGASAGDWIAVTGSLGGSLIKHHYDFTPRVREGILLSDRAMPTAMIDISDGLVQDLAHILRASGVGAVLDLDAIPVSRDAKRMGRGNKAKALASALNDGEDFELLFTVPLRKKISLNSLWKKRFPGVPLTWIGRIEGETPEIQWTIRGKKVPAPELLKEGFSHF